MWSWCYRIRAWCLLGVASVLNVIIVKRIHMTIILYRLRFAAHTAAAGIASRRKYLLLILTYFCLKFNKIA